ncbi:uracil-DNA glycosylase [Ectothiorhodospira lacustris]|uniref:uracil-DNA glycosylase n=1 Tax=Ectothiorhodospira lacustris TaxID=2899127 RepID=UPI001EE7B794|nr:uracil-DNA glycosylase [Ectothiorhodospira lacustris]MCG5499965.1 uracil-DNA glycosylase [Ectothiorhodospira lacustris]MCG5510937.1 uracil-DNA glycosylase [Ectothiorhodospira lacustris]MCG5522669.1 uracil-DNA glycosylase [Ectothiorhodospira lacustris]
MEEGLRRRYLEAMGIPQWVPRAPCVETPAWERPSAAKAAPVPRQADSLGDRVPDWETLTRQVETCTRCTELAASRTRTVFGVGDRQAPWLFIGEAPGVDEDRRGEPFVGRAGKLLDSMLAALGLARGEGVYIANILKCRPPGNRDPKPEEARACRAFLDGQIALIRPRVIVALGRIAAQNLLDTDAALGSLRGRPRDYQGIPVVVTYHPAYLLRKPLDKRKAWEDLCVARRLMIRSPDKPVA